MFGLDDILGIGAGIGLDFIGGGIKSYYNRKAAAQQNSYNLYMSSTAHQREVEDLKAAGLNPILSANGGAAAPSAGLPSSAEPSNSSSISSALTARRVGSATIDNLHSQEAKNRAEARAVAAQERYTEAQTASALEQARRLKRENDEYEALSDVERQGAARTRIGGNGIGGYAAGKLNEILGGAHSAGDSFSKSKTFNNLRDWIYNTFQAPHLPPRLERKEPYIHDVDVDSIETQRKKGKRR